MLKCKHIFCFFILISAGYRICVADVNNSNNLLGLYTNNTFDNTLKEYSDDDNNIITVKKVSNQEYSKIGNEEDTRKNPWRKIYAGIDIHWAGKRFGDNVDGFIAFPNFWRRFQNLDAYVGVRMFRFFGVDLGGRRIIKKKSKHAKKDRMDGAYLSGMFYTPHLDLKYTTVEGYISVGGSMLFGINGNKPDFGAKFGTGLIFNVLGPLSVNLGVDYIYPMHHFANKGFLTFKTGFNLYLNI